MNKLNVKSNTTECKLGRLYEAQDECGNAQNHSQNPIEDADVVKK